MSAHADAVGRRAARDGLLLSADVAPDEMQRIRRSDGWIRLRRGAYLAAAADSLPPHLERRRVALARVRAVHAGRTAPAWFSHTSAALVWGCDLLVTPEDTHLVQRHRPHGRGDRTVVRHHGDVAAPDRAVVDGVPVTGLERTVVDCACLLPRDQGLVVADSALRLGADPQRIDEIVARAAGRRGIAAARDVVSQADGRAESPGETLTRWHLARHGLPAPDLQVEVRTRLGTFRADLGWPGPGLLLEFDGFVKYAGSDGRGAADAVFAEKRRQDALEEAGWHVLRVTWPDLRTPASLARRVRDALARAARGPTPGPTR